VAEHLAPAQNGFPVLIECGATASCFSSYFVDESTAIIFWNTRADLPRATADGPTTTYKDKRKLTDAERFKWRKVYNDYTFNNCDHEHDGYPNHLVCAECTFELLAYFATPHATGETTVEAALAELREMFPKAGLHVYVTAYTIGAENTENNIHKHVEVVVTEHMTGKPKRFYGQSLTDCMAQVRSATRTEGEGEKS
jgi:hypothetical protein